MASRCHGQPGLCDGRRPTLSGGPLAAGQIAELLAKAESADSAPLQAGLTIPEEIKRREDRIARLGEARRVMEERAKERLLEERAQYEEKIVARQAREEATGKKAGGKAPEPPKEGPRDKDQYNFTDPESRIMKAGGGFEQCYNAQAAVEVTTMLIVGQHVTDQANDKQQLVPTLAVVSPVIDRVAVVLVDSGYYSENAVQTVESEERPPIVYAAMKRQSHGRSVAQLESARRPAAAGRIRGRADGASVGYRGRQRTLQLAQGNRGTSIWHHQASTRFPALPAARQGKGRS